MKKIAAIVVTYNRKELLLQCIDHLLHQSKGNPDVLIIDNSSTDGTHEAVNDRYADNDQVIYYNTGKNIGGAGGFSYGINVAVNLGYECLWIMDDDTFPTDTALEELINASEVLNDSYGFLSSYVKWTDGSSCVMNLPGIKADWYLDDVSRQFDNRMMMIERASFVSMFIRSDIVREVGLPIKEFFIWGDDEEYSLRISSRYNSYFVYESQVVHAIKANTAASIIEEKDPERLKRFKYLYRNKYYIARHTSWRAWVSYWLEMNSTVFHIVFSRGAMKLKKLTSIYSGCLQGMFFFPKIEKVHTVGEYEGRNT